MRGVLPADSAPSVEGVIMALVVHRAAKLTLLSIVCLLCLATAPNRADDVTSLPAGETPTAAEVRLRKLHLVRPDLIPYPIAYEVCC